MKFVKVDPPGTICLNDVILSQANGAQTFIEVGCGNGELSAKLCELGLHGVGFDSSPEALAQASKKLKPFIDMKQYTLYSSDFISTSQILGQFDLGLSIMVVEHVENDLGFVKKLASHVKPGGIVMIGAPARKDRWNVEDETVGHLRRYEREDLQTLLANVGLTQIRIFDIAVPVANFLFHLSNTLIKRSHEMKKQALSPVEQTQTSGLREIPFKTVFPPFFKLILNRYVLYPIILLQRCFYNSGLGLTIIGIGRVPK